MIKDELTSKPEPSTIPLLKGGDIVFFRRVKREPRRNAKEIGFRDGFGFGVMLGITSSKFPMPLPEHLTILMGQAGYISFDDIYLLLGEDVAKSLIKKFEEKYYRSVPVDTAPKLILT